MPKFSRNQRIAVITKYLTENPNVVINLNQFMTMFNAAKSTVSEDIVVVREVMKRMSLGKIETISGASGGIKYTCAISQDAAAEFAVKLCETLIDKSRIVPGEFIYISDILFNPTIVHRAGVILGSSFSEQQIDYVVTVETKGIPLAYEVAKMLGVNLIIVRRGNKVTEGPTVSINYVSGSSNRIQTMSLSKKSIRKNSKCVFIDDFMKAGGTAIGIIDLLKEFDSELVGIGVLIDNVSSNKKLKEKYVSIVQFRGIGQDGNPIVSPATDKK